MEGSLSKHSHEMVELLF